MTNDDQDGDEVGENENDEGGQVDDDEDGEDDGDGDDLSAGSRLLCVHHKLWSAQLFHLNL